MSVKAHPQRMEAENEEEVEKLSSIPSAVSEPRWALHMSDNKCRERGFKLSTNCDGCDRRRRCSPYVKRVQKVFLRKAIKVEGAGRAEGFFSDGSYGQLLAWNNSCTQCANVSTSEKLGAGHCWQTETVSGKMEQTAGGNTRRRTRRSSSL